MSKPHHHHLLYPKVLHRAQEPSKLIRQNQWLQPPLDNEIHDELHRGVPFIPVMGFVAMGRVLREFEAVPGDYFSTLDNLLISIDKACNHVRTHGIEANVGQLMIASLDLQRTFLAEGIIQNGTDRVS